MDYKAWLWRKKSTEKIVVATDKVNKSLKENEEEIQMLTTHTEKLESDVKILNDKLSSALSECNAKDDIVKKHEKMALEATDGLKKAEAEAGFLKQKLDEAVEQRGVNDERLTHLDSALKECMQQLRFVRDEQEQRIHDAVMKTSTEYEKGKVIMEKSLVESRRSYEKLAVENTRLGKELLAMGKMIEDLKKQKSQSETDFSSLMTRLKSIEKENSSLKYEVRVLEKEIDVRNEDKEFRCRTAEASHKQHLESVKKIAKLETECQRLRLLVRKRLPGPAALAKMKNEVEMLGKDSIEVTRRKLSYSPTRLMVDNPVVNNYPDSPNSRNNILTEQLCAMDEENKALKEALGKKTNELQYTRTMYSRLAPKLSEDAQIEEPLKLVLTTVPNKGGFLSHEVSVASSSDIGSEDKVSYAESGASALISEWESLKNEKHRGSPSFKSVGASEMDLMDDFVEMERMAVVSEDKLSGSSPVDFDKTDAIVGSLEAASNEKSSEVMDMNVTSRSDFKSSFGTLNQPMNSKEIGELPNWLQDILKVVLEKNSAARKSPDDILKDIGVALSNVNHSNPQCELEVGTFGQMSEADKLCIPSDLFSTLPNVDVHNNFSSKEELQENGIPGEFLNDIKIGEEHLNDGGLKSHCNNNDSPLKKQNKSDKTCENLQRELDALKNSNVVTMDQVQDHELIQKEHDTKLTVAKVESKEECQKFSSIKEDSENKISCCVEMESKNVQPHLEPESGTEEKLQEEKQLRKDWEITAASEKLAECQETILNLGKQIKALANLNPKETTVCEKAITTPTPTPTPTTTMTTTTTTTKNNVISQRSSLLDRMIDDDDSDKSNDFGSPHNGKLNSSLDSSLVSNGAIKSLEKTLVLNGKKRQDDNALVNYLAIVPMKNHGGKSLWKKLLWRKTKGKSKKPLHLFAQQQSFA